MTPDFGFESGTTITAVAPGTGEIVVCYYAGGVWVGDSKSLTITCNENGTTTTTITTTTTTTTATTTTSTSTSTTDTTTTSTTQEGTTTTSTTQEGTTTTTDQPPTPTTQPPPPTPTTLPPPPPTPSLTITNCPEYFVPGHHNTIEYQFSPSEYDARNLRLRIFKRGEDNQPIGEPVYSETYHREQEAFPSDGEVVYAGIDINLTDKNYIAEVSVWQDGDGPATDSDFFEVAACNLYYLFVDVAVDGYATGIEKATVTSASVKMYVWYYDETVQNKQAVGMGDIAYVADMSDGQCSQLGISKQHYVDLGGVYVPLVGDFYVMSDDDQYLWLMVNVQGDGVHDKAGNMFDANPQTTPLEATVKYKLRVSGDYSVQIVETHYE